MQRAQGLGDPARLLSARVWVAKQKVLRYIEAKSAEDAVLCRGVGPRIWGMQQRVPTFSLFLWGGEVKGGAFEILD